MHVLAAVRVNVWQPGAGHSLHIQHARCWHTARSPLAVNNTLLHSWTAMAKKKAKSQRKFSVFLFILLRLAILAECLGTGTQKHRAESLSCRRDKQALLSLG